MSDSFYLDAEPYQDEAGDGAFYLDAEPYDPRPSWGDAAKQAGKNYLTGAAGLVDLANVVRDPAAALVDNLFGNPNRPDVRQVVDAAIPDTVSGGAADVVRAAQEASLFPVGGMVTNALAGAGAELGAKAFPNSKVAPLLFAAVPGVARSAIGSPMRAVATNLRNRSMGLTARDYASAANNLDLGTVGQGKARLLDALDAVEESVRAEPIGALRWYGRQLQPTEAFLTKTIKDAARVNEGNSQAVGKIITAADEALQAPSVEPNRDLIKNAVERLSALDKKKVGARVQEYEKAFSEATGRKAGATMGELQSEKVGLNAMLESQPREQMAQNIWRRAVRSGIEQSADELAAAGRISGRPGDLAKANLKFGATEELIKGLGKDMPAAQAADLVDQIRQAGFTTSGLGLQGMRVLNEAVPGLGIIGTLASATSYFKPVGRVLGQAGRDVGSMLKGAPLSQKLLAAAAIAAAAEENDDTLDEGNASLQENLQKDKADDQRPDDEQRLSAEKGEANKEKTKKDKNRSHSSLFSPRGGSSQAELFGGANAGNNTLFASTAKKNGDAVKPEHKRLVERVMPVLFEVESGGKADAVSSKGAQGLGQLMPATGREWHRKLNLPGKYDPFDKEQNAKISTAYYSWLLGQFDGDARLALAAYNYGIGNIKKAIEKHGNSFAAILPSLPGETRKYVARISERADLA